MWLYRFIKDENVDFKRVVVHIANDWDALANIAEKVHDGIHKYKNDISSEGIKEEVDNISKDRTLPRLMNGQEKYWDLLVDGLLDKLKRIVALESANGEFDDADFRGQIMAVTKGAYYYYLRDRLEPRTKEEEVAQFLFIREYCYGSMFRFNKNGKFNIPYGGASYNDKRLHEKLEYAFSANVLEVLKGARICSMDFREFFKAISEQINEDDFCFFDPPYDTEFSEYDGHAFRKGDQADLARLFGKLRCRSVMIIKKTDYISSIYSEQSEKDPRIKIDEYEKSYTYNVRGRNVRGVTHLLIRNY